MNKAIGIFSIYGDLHAHVIRHELQTKYNTAVFVFEVDQIAGSNNYNLFTDSDNCNHLSITDSSGETISINYLDKIWWRRRAKVQNYTNSISDESHKDLINNDTYDALNGGLTSVFEGEWVNGINETEIASNKLIQTKIARECGFNIPKTIITQSTERLIDFVSSIDSGVIVKPMRGTKKSALRAVKLYKDNIQHDLDISSCPTMYQEYIEGTRHYRVHCFGSNIITVLIETEQVDWRSLTNCKFKGCKLPQEIEEKIKKFLDLMNLKMGVIDIKQSSDGEFYWLEINPQGQFLFWEPLIKNNLSNHFCEFLIQ
ncbi:ATP-grasp domain-containing protein [Brevibacillus laterosporus]|uniref:ATP-grasp domain-containing protein n=1 Tax=Brevibacillus laterosporus TaxID=1465 RepID=UPI000839D61C|nr:ATP-grasp domain-containing protein [Brevibacillus laterosporus]